MKETTRKMTPEERQAKLDHIYALINAMTDEQRGRVLKKLQELEITRELFIIGHQDANIFFTPMIMKTVKELEKKSDSVNRCVLFCNIFNYGYIQGKRAERARKKARECKKAQGGQQTEPAHQENPTR